MPDPQADQRPAQTPDSGGDDIVQLIKAYIRQETLAPIVGWGRYLAFGLMGALVVGLGLVVVLLGMLRVLQTETDAFDGPSASIVPYLVTLFACFVVFGVALWQVKRRTTLQRKERKS